MAYRSDRADRGPPGRHPRPDRRRRARAGGRGRLRVRLGPGRGRPRGRGRGHRLPPLPVEGRAVRRGLPHRRRARARRGGRGDRRRRPRRRRADAPPGAEAFCRRALAAPTLAYAQIAEPVDPAVESERLRLRRGYRDVFALVLDDGVRVGRARAPRHRHRRRRPGRRARRGPGRPAGAPASDRRSDALVATLVHFCLSACPTTDRSPPAMEPVNSPPPTRRHPRGLQPGAAARSPYNVFDADAALREALEREGGAGAPSASATPARWPAARRRSSTPSAASATSRSCAPTTATATASTRSSSTRPGTGCCARRSSAGSTRCRGATRRPRRAHGPRRPDVRLGARSTRA